MMGLIDCNNFYVSCERAFNPSLEGKPIGILSNNDGCVIARSNELKPLVPMGMPAFKIPNDIKRKICLLSSNYELYGDMSRRVFDIIQNHIAHIEIYSIDEAFLHLQSPQNTIEYCQSLRKIIKRGTGIPISIGLSNTKTLAKIANHIAKKNPTHHGVYFLPSTGTQTAAILSHLPVSEIWGVGRQLSAKIEAMGIKTAWQLCDCDPSYMGNLFSVSLERTIIELQGTPCIDFDHHETIKKNIMTSSSFGKTTWEYIDVQEAITAHTHRGAEKLRSQQSLAQAILVLLQTSRFYDQHLQYNPSITIPLPYPTSDTRLLVQAAQQGLHKIFKKQYLYQKAGVMMLDLIHKDTQQLDFFSPSHNQEAKQQSDTLMKTLDLLNQKMGKDTIHFGKHRPHAAWTIKRNRLTQRYTTRWDEIPIAKA